MASPTYDQAQLQLKLYDLRRETRLRQARDWYWQKYWADTLDEAMRVAPMGTEAGNFFMMVVSYWDQACAYLNYGLLHEDLFFETSGEFFGVWELAKPMVPQARERLAEKQDLGHLEETAPRYESWIKRMRPGHIPSKRGLI